MKQLLILTLIFSLSSLHAQRTSFFANNIYGSESPLYSFESGKASLTGVEAHGKKSVAVWFTLNHKKKELHLLDTLTEKTTTYTLRTLKNGWYKITNLNIAREHKGASVYFNEKYMMVIFRYPKLKYYTTYMNSVTF